MERESATVWELSFVVPPNHGNAFSPAWCLPFHFKLVVNLYVELRNRIKECKFCMICILTSSVEFCWDLQKL